MESLFWISLTILLQNSELVKCQFFHPTLSDQAYLDQIAKEIQWEVDDAESNFLNQAKVVENSTEIFISSKLKHNAFNALRLMAEKELTNSVQIPGQRLKEPKQEQEDELSSLENAVQVNGEVFQLLRLVPLIPANIFSFLREAFKTIFPSENGMKQGAGTGTGTGIGTDKNKEKVKVPPKAVVNKAEIFMNQPKDVQLLGVLSLMAQDMQDQKNQDLLDSFRVNDKTQQSLRGGRVNRRRLEAEEQAKIQTLNFLTDFRKSFKLLDEKSAAIYGGVQEAYTFLSNLRNVASLMESNGNQDDKQN